MLEWIFTLLVLYLIYKLVFDFILPVTKATSQVRSKIKEMQQTEQRDVKSSPVNPPRNNASKEADYIDFEEIK